jgi:hypothetical protein
VTPYETADLLDVENNFAFLPIEGRTYCNCYASVFCAARGIRLPPELANEQLLHLIAHPEEWEQVTREMAHAIVNTDAGATVLAVAEHTEHGHIGALVESPPSDPTGLYVSAAGARNFKRAKLETSFGFLKPAFFTRRKGATHG